MTMLPEAPAEVPPSRPRRRLRFSLRTTFFLTTVVAVTLGLAHHRAEQQRNAVEAIEAFGGSVTYSRQMHAPGVMPLKPVGPQWLRDWLGPHWFDHVVALNFDSNRWRDRDQLSAILPQAVELQSVRSIVISGQDIDSNEGRVLAQFQKLEAFFGSSLKITPRGAEELARAPRLQNISLDNVVITTPGLEALAESSSLRSLRLDAIVTRPPEPGLLELPSPQDFKLNFQAHPQRLAQAPKGTWLADDGLQALTHCKQLRSLHLANTGITDAGVAELRHFELLQSLELGSPYITGVSLQTIAALPHLEHLSASKWCIAADDFTPLEAARRLKSLNLHTDLAADAIPKIARLTQLITLTLVDPKLGDAALPDLHALKNLRLLIIPNTSVDPLGVAAQELQQALPRCSITLPLTPAAKQQIIQRAQPMHRRGQW
jgi:hypothetical protein